MMLYFTANFMAQSQGSNGGDVNYNRSIHFLYSNLMHKALFLNVPKVLVIGTSCLVKTSNKKFPFVFHLLS